MTKRNPEAVAPPPDMEAGGENPSPDTGDPGSGGAPPGTDGSSEFSVWIADDRLAVLVDCPNPHAGLAVAVARIIAELEGFALPSLPTEDAIAARITEHCQPGKDAVACPILAGTPPVPAVDGRLEWTEDFFASGFEVNAETGAIDYWSRVDRRSVREGQLLARILPPIRGKDGTDVLGNPIKVPEPKPARLRAAKNVGVEETEEATLYTATVNGRLRHKDGTVTVDEIYVIRGNVSLETGHINHTGAVTIEGDVETGAHIEAEGEIIVRGLMEPCTIVGGGNLVVGGGIVGNEDHHIEVAGNLQARYIHDATIVTRGNVEVTNEITHSQIRTAGKVVVATGRLAGGSTMAHRGIKVARAGAEGSSRTELIAGLDPFLDEKTVEPRAQLTRLTEARDKITEALDGAAKRHAELSEDEQKTVRDLEKKLHKIDQAEFGIMKIMKEIRREADRRGVPKIVILTETVAGCVLQIGDARLKVNQSCAKPRIAELKRARVRLLPLGDGNLPEDL